MLSALSGTRADKKASVVRRLGGLLNCGVSREVGLDVGIEVGDGVGNDIE